ncbi:MAG: hypothetical protein PHH13_05170 [Candidatus Peribacteraceae bacterium]|nr:hypothetical protein [Candidatus Peribacteraceae bacterium]
MSSTNNVESGTDRTDAMMEDMPLGQEPLDMDIDLMRAFVTVSLRARRLSEETLVMFQQISAPNTNSTVSRYILFKLAKILRIPVIRKRE